MRHIIFPNDISYIRKNKKLSQNKLSKIIGISRPELSYIENGHFLPEKNDLEKIAKELGVLVSELYSIKTLNIIIEMGNRNV